MEINQFVEFSAAVLRSLPRDLSSFATQKWIANQRLLADVIHKALTPPLDLYLHPEQLNKGGMSGLDLKRHLEKTGLINRCLSLQDDVVSGWIINPSSYPKEFGGEMVHLWKSQRTVRDWHEVAYIRAGGVGGGVFSYWSIIGPSMDSSSPALLASPAS